MTPTRGEDFVDKGADEGEEMSVHEQTMALAPGQTETPMARLQRQRDEAVEHLEEIVGASGAGRSMAIGRASMWLGANGLGERA